MRRGFTLIELLVVISIISLLIAITLPALSNARQQARITVCLSQMRSISQGIAVYTVDSNSFYPDGPRGRRMPTWIAESGSYDLRDELRDYLGTQNLEEILICPMTAEGWWSLDAQAARRQLDPTAVSSDRKEIPYLFYFGQNALDPSDNIHAGSYGHWGREQAMIKAGEFWKPDWGHDGSAPEFDILMSDTLVRPWGEQVTMASHSPFGGRAPISLDMTGVYGTFKVPVGVDVTANYARTDGSAKTYSANFNSVQGDEFMGFDGADGGTGPHDGIGPMLPADMAR